MPYFVTSLKNDKSYRWVIYHWVTFCIKDGVQQFSSTEAKAKYHLGNPNTINKNKKVLQNKDIVEMKGGKMMFVDPIYRQWFAREYE